MRPHLGGLEEIQKMIIFRESVIRGMIWKSLADSHNCTMIRCSQGGCWELELLILLGDNG